MRTKKQQFIDACKRQPAYWLKMCADNPGKYMTKMDVLLIRLALRRGWYL